MNSSNTKIVKSGSTFQISLKGNMSTGYRWCLARLPESLCLVGEELYSDPHPPQVVGVGDTQVFYFKAMKSTLAPESLSFIRMRVWNDDIIEEQVWQVTVSQNENEVSYQVVNNYVVGHEVKAGKHYFIFDKFDQFQKVFYPAAVMGSQRWLTVEDFAHHVVIAVIEPENNAVSDYEFKQTPHISGHTLVIDYVCKENPAPETTFRFSKILMVQRGDYEQVTFIDNGTEKETLPVANDSALV